MRYVRGSLLVAVVTIAVVWIFAAGEAGAVGTRSFRLDTLEELKGGDLQGASVDSRGRVRAGLVLGALPLGEANAVWSALALKDGAVLLGTGNQGTVLRIYQGKMTVLADTKQMAVTSMVHDAKGVTFAATIPNGKIFRIDAAGKVSEWVTLPDTEHVWALALDPKTGAVFAATGPEGKLFRIDANARAQVYFDSDEPHLVSLALAPNGTIYAGSSGKAILYRIAAPGRASVLHDFEGDEVKALSLAPDGRLYAISNEYAEPPKVPETKATSSQRPASPTKTTKARPKPGKGRLTRFDPDGRVEQMLFDKEAHFQSLTLGPGGLPHVGTGDEGRVYAVDDAHTAILMADTDSRQVGAMLLDGPVQFLAASDPAVFHTVRGMGGTEAVWTSKALDAGIRARFGMLTWRSTAPVELSSRTGNTEKPDTTWSDWGPPMRAPGKIPSPPGRYLQLRARFGPNPTAIVTDIEAFFVTDNLRAIVTSVTTERSKQSKTGEVPESGADAPKASTKVKLSWTVDNPDSDKLQFLPSYRLQGSSAWRPMVSPDELITSTTYEWDTAGLPEGVYEVRVEATDVLANPPALAQSHALESAAVLVDNTPPVFQQLQAVGRRIQGRVVDGVGPIVRIEVSFDPHPDRWYPYYSKDGIFDEKVEDFDFELGALVGTTPRVIAVRAYDAAGNPVVKSVDVR